MNDIKSADSANTHTYSVLIIDDSEEDRYLLKRYLKKTELSLLVLEATNGQEALELLTTPLDTLRKQHPSLRAPVIIFLDINMPIMNGWEFVSALEHNSQSIQLKPTVVMMYSTASEDEEKDKIHDYSSVKGYLVKGESTVESIKNTILETIVIDQ